MFFTYKSLLILLLMFGLSACADMSMYNHVPAPIEQPGQSPSGVKVYPIESPEYPEYKVVEQYKAPQPAKVETPSNPAVIALLNDAQQKQQQGQLDVAASKLERAVRIAPRDARVWYQLALIRFQQNRYESAESLAKKSIHNSASNNNLQHKNWLLIARCRDALGRYEAAKKARIEAERSKNNG